MMPLAALLAPRELVAFVGGGGKTTLLLRLAAELAERGRCVVVTTTTRMAADEVRALGPPLSSSEPAAVEAACGDDHPVLLISDATDDKVVGPPPGALDTIFATTRVDYLLVEADGARRLPLKAPAEHEPVIPQRATLVVIVAGAGAIGQPIRAVAHRPERVAQLSGRAIDEQVTADVIAAVVGHDAGGLKGVPEDARVVVAITNADTETGSAAAEHVGALLADHPRIERVVPITGHRPPDSASRRR